MKCLKCAAVFFSYGRVASSFRRGDGLKGTVAKEANKTCFCVPAPLERRVVLEKAASVDPPFHEYIGRLKITS